MGQPLNKLRERLPWHYAEQALEMLKISDPMKAALVNRQYIYNVTAGNVIDYDVVDILEMLAEKEDKRKSKLQKHI